MDIKQKFHDDWHFLCDHKIFNETIIFSDGTKRITYFERDLDIIIVKVNPKTKCIEDDSSLNTEVRIWLETGPIYMEEDYDMKSFGMHDYELDTGGATFEEAIVNLAELVRKTYGDDTTGSEVIINKKDMSLSMYQLKNELKELCNTIFEVRKPVSNLLGGAPSGKRDLSDIIDSIETNYGAISFLLTFDEYSGAKQIYLSENMEDVSIEVLNGELKNIDAEFKQMLVNLKDEDENNYNEKRSYFGIVDSRLTTLCELVNFAKNPETCHSIKDSISRWSFKTLINAIEEDFGDLFLSVTLKDGKRAAIPLDEDVSDATVEFW